MKIFDENVSIIENIQTNHDAFLRRIHEKKDIEGEEVRSDLIEFLKDIKSGGEQIFSLGDRREAQRTVNYWAGYFLRNDLDFGDLKPPILLNLPNEANRPEFEHNQSPYRGLKSFDSKQYFFGRERATARLMELVEQHDVTIVHGESGQGKSSLIKAGFKPLFEEKATGIEIIGPVVPGEIVGHATAEIIQKRLPEIELENIRDQLTNPRSVNNILKKYNPAGSLVIIDQFEELFTQQGTDVDAAVKKTISVIQKILSPNKVIIILRSEFLKRFKALLGKKSEHVAYFKIPRMSYHELKRAILGPARIKGLIIEPRVVESVISDVLEERASLPLLQFTLDKLWEKRVKNEIRYDVYKKIGSPHECLKREADEIYNSLTSEEKRIAESIFKDLSTPDGYRQRVQKPKLKENLDAIGLDTKNAFEHVLGKFVDAELIRLSSSETYDVVHEALMVNWPKYQNWLSQKIRHQDYSLFVEVKAKRWAKSGKNTDLLINDRQELEQQSIYREHSIEVASYLAASSAYVQANEQSKKLKKRVSIFALVGLIFVGTLLSLLFQSIQRGHYLVADQQRKALKLAFEKTKNLEEDLEDLKSINSEYNDSDQILFKQLKIDKWIESQTSGFIDIDKTVKIIESNEIPRKTTDDAPFIFQPESNRGDVSSSCTGHIWLGSDDSPKVYSNSEKLVSNIKPGDKLTATSSLKLREWIKITGNSPNSTYSAGAQKGTVVNYVKVEAIDSPQKYWNKARTTENYWVEVKAPMSACYGVFVQYSTDQEFYLAEQTRRYLRDIYGFNVAQIEKVPFSSGQTKTKFHSGNPEMLEVSNKLNLAFTEIFKQFAEQPNLLDSQKQYFRQSIPNEPIPESYEYSPNLEIWIGPMPSQDQNHWTPWYNRDTPGGSGDVEWISFEGDYCSKPINMECQVVGKPSVKVSKDICQPTYGSLCENDDTICEDYEIRLQCPPSN